MQCKQIVKDLVSAGRHSERIAYEIASISRTAYRHQGKQAAKDVKLEAALLARAKQYRTMATRCCMGCLRTTVGSSM